MDSHLGTGLLAAPVVLCIGITTEQFAALAEASDGSVAMLYLPDRDTARRMLADEPAVASVPAPREPAAAEHRVVECGKLRLDADLREVSWRGDPMPLSAREFDLLYALTCDPGRVWTFAELTAQVWKRPYLGDTDAVASAVKRLRRQVRAVTGSVLIESVRGVGYRIVVLADAGQPIS